MGLFWPEQGLKNLVLTYESFDVQMPNVQLVLVATHLLGLHLPDQLSWAKEDDKQKLDYQPPSHCVAYVPLHISHAYVLGVFATL